MLRRYPSLWTTGVPRNRKVLWLCLTRINEIRATLLQLHQCLKALNLVRKVIGGNVSISERGVRARQRRPTRFKIVSSCSQYYFPLLKGLFLSLIESGELDGRFELSFLDMECSPEAIRWLESQNVDVRNFDGFIMGELASARFGYQRALLCRPFLPQMFPDADVLIWLDCDMWVQDVVGLRAIFEEASKRPRRMLISQEVHNGYITNKFTFNNRCRDMAELYAPIYGARVAEGLSNLPTFNSGLFAASIHHPVWAPWQAEIEEIFLRRHSSLSPFVLHFAEQISLNVVLRRIGAFTCFDSSYNYVSLWNPPVRDEYGVVRHVAPPHLPVGVIHLAGGWRNFGRGYLRRRLLYRDGAYLTATEKEALGARPTIVGIR